MLFVQLPRGVQRRDDAARLFVFIGLGARLDLHRLSRCRDRIANGDRLPRVAGLQRFPGRLGGFHEDPDKCLVRNVAAGPQAVGDLGIVT